MNESDEDERWVYDEMRRVGVQHGLVSGLIALKREIDSRTYRPIPPHFTRRLREREIALEPLRKVYANLQAQLEAFQAAMDAQQSLIEGDGE